MKVISDVELEAHERLPQEQAAKQLGAEQHKVLSHPGYELIWEAATRLTGTYIKPPQAGQTCKAHPRPLCQAILTGKPYPVKALIALASNPLLQVAETRLVYQALKSPNLEHVVVMDYYMTPTAELADYVLPAASTLERSDFPFLPKALEPLYQRKNDYEFWREVHPSMVSVQHGWWFPEKPGQDPELHGLWDSNANVLTPMGEEFCSPEVGGWPY